MTPIGDSYSCTSGGVIAAGRYEYPSEVLNLIAAAPANSWIKLNTNTYQSAWSSSDARQAYPYTGVGSEDPSRILGKWGSAGWDKKRSQFVVFGGGHANIGLNEVYAWSAYTRQWRLAFNGTALHQVDSYPTYRSVDGNNSPISTHCYGNNNYLPHLDRFFTGGGAAVGNGGPLNVWSGDTLLRSAGGYTLDMSLAGKGYVAGDYGSNIHYGTASADLPGANAWKLRDWCALNPATLTTGSNGNILEKLECGTAVAFENGHDVLYWSGNGRMWRTEFIDDTPSNDIVTQVTGYQNAVETNGALAFDPVRRVLLSPNGRRTDQRLFYMIDLDSATTSAGWESIYSMTGDDQAGFLGVDGLTTSSGIAYHDQADAFVLWMKGRQPWILRPPAGNPTPTTSWVVEKPVMDTETTCPPGTLDANDSGVIGKFKYAPDLGCCVCIENIFDGNVWALKLAGWTDPRT